MFNKLLSQRNNNLIIFLSTIIIIIPNGKLTNSKNHLCYAPIFLETSWTDHRPEFVVNMTFSKQGNIRSLTWVNKDIPAPIVKLKFLQQQENNKVNTLYNLTARLCDLQQFTNKISMFNQALQTVFKQGNYSLQCPMKQGFYVMENMRVAKRNPLWSFVYQPKTKYTIIGGIYEKAENGTLITLTFYKMVIKVLKKSCSDF